MIADPRSHNARHAAVAATTSSAPAAAATGSDVGSSLLTTVSDQCPSAAASGIRTRAVSTSSPRTALLAAASATALPVSSQVAHTGGRRPAKGRAATMATTGSSSGT
jgi:hypothetical protein